jgi:ABC-type polysaccharide/polyol phosphate transport system ATPase subunit
VTVDVLQLNNIWVSYPDDNGSLFKRLFRREGKRFWALRGIDFNVKKGEVLGVIGRNGSGKSTLLRVLSGLIEPDKGEYIVRGQRPVLLSLGAGFKPELSGIDNIYLNSLLLGHRKEDVDALLEEIIRFSELGQFIYKPVRTYSAGMRARLAFSTAITLDPEILLIDEVLGVGDEAFKAKCREAIMQKVADGRTVILVTHSASLIQAICDRVVWIHLGEQKAVGETKDIIKEYQAFMKGKQP